MQQRNSIAPGGWLTDLSSALLQQYYRRRILQNPNVPRKLLKAAIFEKIIFQLFKNFSKIIFYFLPIFEKTQKNKGTKINRNLIKEKKLFLTKKTSLENW